MNGKYNQIPCLCDVCGVYMANCADRGWKMSEKQELHCVRCGTLIKAFPGNRKYCEDCRLEVRRELDRQRKKVENEKTKNPKPPKKKNQSRIDELAKAARAAGISYGRYKAMLDMGLRIAL